MTALTTPVTYGNCQTGNIVDPPNITLNYPPLSDLNLPYDELLGSQIPLSLTPLFITCLVALALLILARFAIAGGSLRKSLSIGIVLAAVIITADLLTGWATVRYHPQLIARFKMDTTLKVISVMSHLYESQTNFPNSYVRRHGRYWHNGLEQLQERLTAQVIKQALEQKKTETAMQYAMPMEGRQALSPFISRAYAYSAVDYMGMRTPEKALEQAKRATRIWFDRYSEENLNRVAALFAIEQSQAQEYQASSDLLNNISANWIHSQSQQLVSYLERQQFLHLFNSEITQESLNKTITMTRFLRNIASRYPGSMGQNISCDLGALLELKAEAAIENRDISEAISNLLEVEKLVVGAPRSQVLIPELYRIVGFEKMQNQQYLGAVSDFEIAHSRLNTKESACELAEALNQSALASADNLQFAGAYNTLTKSRALCSTLPHTSLLAQVHYAEGQYHMQRGEWHEAKKVFSQAARHALHQDQALAHLRSISELQSYQRRLQTISGIGSIPDVTGQRCIEADPDKNIKFCDMVLLYSKGSYQGYANGAYDEVVFDRGGNNFIQITDTDHDGRFDQWRNHQPGSDLVILDNDGDGRPDWELVYNGERLANQKALSGRISVRIPAAVVGARNVDIFSKPDVFLAAWKNDSFLGRTSVRDNTNYPTWYNEAFAVHYRYRDQFTLAVFDEDWFDDEFIDAYRVNTLPQTGIVLTDDQKVGLQLVVTPTSLPEGVHLVPVDEAAEVNLFIADSFKKDNLLSGVVQQANAEEARAEVAAIVGAIAVPEAGVFTLFRSASLLTRLAIHWIGFDVVHASLTENDSIQLTERLSK